ncbi:ribonuclease H-like domain-containing protein [Truncatella angustata]|uniref:Ribonuclease H-like domain-containing protein n=1 Tax=Truncatella angustata TaxID=152316 RepID=A0A9P8ZYL4_9PEZI|nr:ribonuclease H-like domain-containing protein [Truncatella angustata]KAH6655297.1 ribonuclease H-like domain-containing protein [Truncatella angustata]KAH8205180.1 hypothetical protein TruAng_000592 [Truncatella angustata]
MTTSPSRSQIWHPSRGISFSPSPSRPSSVVYGSRQLSHSTPALAERHHDALSAATRQEQQRDAEHLYHPIETEPASLYPVLPLSPDAYPVVQAEGGVLAAPASGGPEQKAEEEAPLEPPYPALDYKLSKELYYAAKRAAPGSPASYWSYSLYRGPSKDGTAQKPKVHYCRSKHTAERVCQQYFANEKVLGFDLEWAADSPKSAGPRRNVSLIQLASQSRIALFHVAVFPKDDDFVAPTFKRIMEDAEVTKVGVWIKGDATRLRTHLGIESKGLMELSHLCKLVTYSRTGEYNNINKRLVPLATQVEQYLHLPMFKGQDVRSSDWTKQLSWDQVTYSASDAYAGVHLFATLEHHRKQLDPCPPTPHHAELNLPIRLSDGLDLATDSEDEVSEPPPEDDGNSSGILSPAARKRALLAHLKALKSATKQVARTLRETEDVLDTLAKDPRINAADTWARTFIAENYQSIQDETAFVSKVTSGSARFVELRAYHLWHTNKDLSPEDVAALLRTPPLKTTTVVEYISNAVRLESLPINGLRFDKDIDSRTRTFSRYKKRSQSNLPS